MATPVGDVLMGVAALAVLALIIGVIVFSGRLPARSRKGLEMAFGVTLLLVSACLLGWRAVETLGERQWLSALAYAATAGVAVTGLIRLIGRRAITPDRAGKP